jgi:hypothetical protein
MTKYKHSNFKQIGSAIDVEVRLIAEHKNRFEEAALWYRLTRRRPTRTPPSKMRDKLGEIAKNASRLLRSLGVRNTADAVDGPGSRELLAALVLLGERKEDPIITAVARVGRLTEIIDGLTAAAELEMRAKKGAEVAVKVGKMTVRAGNSGDDAINDWIAAMMGLYRTITGRTPATSVGRPERPNEGIAAGPLIRFLQAAARPLKMKKKLDEDAWRSRVRTILKSRPG